MAHTKNNPARTILLCALSAAACGAIAHASDAISANPLRATAVEPANHVPAQRPPATPIVEYGPLAAQADVPAAAEPNTEHHAREDRPLGEPKPRMLDAETERPLGAASSKDAGRAGGFGDGAARTVIALVAVVGLILAARWVFRRLSLGVGGIAGQLGAGGRAPSGVMEVLGRYPVGKGQTLVLLRLDRRVLLLSQSAQGFSTLTQFDDPQEVASLVVKTADDESASMSARFRSILSSFERDPELGGEIEVVEPGGPTTLRLARQRRAEVVEVTPEPSRGGAVASVRRRLAALRGGEAA